MVLSFCTKTFLVPLHPSNKIGRVWNRPLSLAVWEASLSERFFTFFIDSKIIHVYALQKSEINLELIDKKKDWFEAILPGKYFLHLQCRDLVDVKMLLPRSFSCPSTFQRLWPWCTMGLQVTSSCSHPLYEITEP